jgi:hypothetical protein
MRKPRFRFLLAAGLAAFTTAGALAYPLDGYEETGIRRVEGARLAHLGQAKGGFQPPGAQLPTEAVDLRLLAYPELEVPPPDPELSRDLKALLGEHADDYGIALLDLTDPERPVYAAHRDDYRQNVGSVGKLLVALGYFQALADAWPDDTDQRKAILRDTVITADDFSQHDHHTIRIFDVETRELTRRPMQVGDQGLAWEFLDWMLSVSSNSAAAMVQRDAMLLREFGREYPLTEEAIRTFWAETPGSARTRLFQETFWAPVTRNGMDLSQIRQGSFFTRNGKKFVNGGGNSYATARSLIEYVLRMEKGQLVDEWSSRQVKRLLYMTERRIRYASAPELRKAAVYFKSGSLYSCKDEPGFDCGAYRGNARNYMNSVAIVEQDLDDVDLHYVVIVISNVLRQNSAEAHQALGGSVHRMIRSKHGVPAEP